MKASEINGEKDTQVPAKADLAAIEQALKGGGNRDYKNTHPGSAFRGEALNRWSTLGELFSY